jgi:hypothetical protein
LSPCDDQRRPYCRVDTSTSSTKPHDAVDKQDYFLCDSATDTRAYQVVTRTFRSCKPSPQDSPVRTRHSCCHPWSCRRRSCRRALVRKRRHTGCGYRSRSSTRPSNHHNGPHRTSDRRRLPRTRSDRLYMSADTGRHCRPGLDHRSEFRNHRN